MKRNYKKRLQYVFYFLNEIWNLPKIITQTQDTQTPVRFGVWFMQRVVGINRKAYWPTHFTSNIGNIENIYAGIDTSPGYSPGCYIQGGGKTYIGDYTQIGPNVGIISANHSLTEIKKVDAGTVRIGRYCWLGMNSVILPNVELGDFTIVGAGSVVTKSFPDGFCVIAGNPAKVIKMLDKSCCVRGKNSFEYNGYIPNHKFEAYQKKFEIYIHTYDI